ncbi:hypothetical protein D9615_000406 [Tricholomella constricta]|uniref:Uncharacterized protein n=1 Tax=Tricholomella constricta TaxID=117010 RepID=A0A8H5HQV4_9AGAR|nr:hypothetical protein D9615_000406 [Tricholomella constricta]
MYSILVALLSLAIFATAVPTWDGARGQISINSLVQGTSYIEAVGPIKDDQFRTTHLSLVHPGQPGNLTVLPNSRAPPLFYIFRNQLWLFNNETSIYPVNALNTTNKANFPLQLVVGNKHTGSRHGSWRWHATMLYYDQGTAGNGGLYYSCTMEDGSNGVFIFLKPSPTPPGCETMTLHSWSHTYVNQK